MVLASGAKNQHGQMLLAAGTALEEKHVRILKSWGVVEADIVDSGDSKDAASASDVPPEFQVKAGEVEEQRFVIAERKHPALSELFALAKNRTAKRLWRESHAS